MVEGESDWQTLCYHEEPAVGIPGANGWKAEWAADLEGIDRLYFVVEDEAGEQCWRKLAETPEIRDRLYRVELEGVKDVSKLYKQDSTSFKDKLRKRLAKVPARGLPSQRRKNRSAPEKHGRSAESSHRALTYSRSSRAIWRLVASWGRGPTQRSSSWRS